MMGPVEVWRYIESRGIRYALMRAWKYVFASERWLIITNDWAAQPVASSTDGIVFRSFTPPDANLLRAFEPYRRVRTLLAQVNEGCWLDLALENGIPVAFRIVSPTGPRYPPLAGMINLQPHQVWVLYTFCLPTHRQRGVTARLAVSQDQRLAASGYRQHVAACRLENMASIHYQLSYGGRAVCSISYWRILGYARCKVDPVPPAVEECRI
jgi:hypothetical protein